MARIESHSLRWALLVALTLIGQYANCFESDKLYRYQLEGSVSGRLLGDEVPSQEAGYAISSPLLLKQLKKDQLLVQLEKPQLATFNERQQVAIEKLQFAPIERAQSLDKPFKIYLDPQQANSIRAFDTFKDEPKWVSNFKRGLLAFFQLKLSDPQQQQQQDQAATSGGQYYTTSERSVFGECETDYLVMSNEPQFEGAQPTLNVTKSRNVAKCKSRFHQLYFPLDSSECFDSEKDLQQFKRSSATFQFNLLGSKANYVIDQAHLNEKTVFSPFGQKAQTHQLETKFKLALVSIDPSGSLSADSGAQQSESLAYEPPTSANFYANINLEEEHHLAHVMDFSASVEQVLGLFEALVQEHRTHTSSFEGNDPSLPINYQENSLLARYFFRLHELTMSLNLAKLEQLYAKVDELGDAHKRLFWDVLAVTGTNPGFIFMKKLITEGDAPSSRIKEYLTRLSYHLKQPSKLLFDEYVNLCKSDKIASKQEYKRLCSLPLASVIHQHCVKPHAKYLRSSQSQEANSTGSAHLKKAQNYCQLATAEEYYSRLVQPLGGASSGNSEEAAQSIGDKMFNIKMAGELGVKATIELMQEVLRNKQEHPSLRAAAMWNLQKVAKVYPGLVKKLALPYYYDQGELLEVRIAAFYNWFQTGQSLHELETLAKSLENEPNRQLVLYVDSLLSSIAELEWLPCKHSSENIAKLVLPAVKKAVARFEPATRMDSFGSVSSQWLPEFAYGTTSLKSMIMGNESFAPSNLYYTSSEIMSGLKLVPTSVSVQAHGLDKLVKRVFGINGLLSDKESFMDVFSLRRRNKRQASLAQSDLVKQEVADLDKELKLSARDFSDVYLAVTISVYGRPVAFFDRDSKELKKMLSDDGTIKIPHVKKLLHSFNNHTTQQMMVSFESLELFNNELGLPLFKQLTDFQYKNSKLNTIKLDVEPGFFRDERQFKPATKISASVDAKMGRHIEFKASTGALLPQSREQVGVVFLKKAILNMPIKLGLEIDLVENKVTLKKQPISENLLYVMQTPATYVRSYDPAAGSTYKLDFKPLYDFNTTSASASAYAGEEKGSRQLRDFNVDYMTPLAVGLKAEGKHKAAYQLSTTSVHRVLSQLGLAKAMFMYKFSPTGQPLEVRVSSITTQENPTKELSLVVTHTRVEEAKSDLYPAAVRGLEQVAAEGELDFGQLPIAIATKIGLFGGSTKERKMAIELGYWESASRLLRKWRLVYQRSALSEDPASEPTNLCWLGQVQMPRYELNKWLDLDVSQLDSSVNASSELTFDANCPTSMQQAATSGARLSLNAKFDWTEEQRRAMQQALGDSKGLSKLEKLVAECKQVREATGAKMHPSCLEVLRQASQLSHVSLKLKYQDVPSKWRTLLGRLARLYTSARANYLEEMEEKSAGGGYNPAAATLSDQMELEANVSRSRKLSYELDTPTYRVLYKNLPPIPLLPMPSVAIGAPYYRLVRQHSGFLSCQLSGRQVETFDKLNYSLPQIQDGCYYLLAKDCSPEASYTVLASQLGTQKALKIYLANKHKLEVLPSADAKGPLKLSILLDGQPLKLEPNQPAYVQKIKVGAVTKDAFRLDLNDAYLYVQSAMLKFSLVTDGNSVVVQQTQYHNGKSCGLCGDANGNQLGEFKPPSSSKRTCRSSQDFAWSYVIPSTCASRPTGFDC